MRLADVRAAVAHAGRMVAEAPRLWLAPSRPLAIPQAPNASNAAWSRGRGIVFLTPHMGCFEMSVQAVVAALVAGAWRQSPSCTAPRASAGWPR